MDPFFLSLGYFLKAAPVLGWMTALAVPYACTGNWVAGMVDWCVAAGGAGWKAAATWLMECDVICLDWFNWYWCQDQERVVLVVHGVGEVISGAVVAALGGLYRRWVV
jgi:hypothetical protein